MTKSYRLKVRKVPLNEDIPSFAAKFPPFQELYLELLENKQKLKKNPPKPIFVRAPEPEPEHKSEHREEDDDDYLLKELEDIYEKREHDEPVFSDHDEELHEDTHHDREDEEHDTQPHVYQQAQFQQQEEEEEDEEERERKEKADYIFKFMVLRRQYPNVEIPEFTEHSDFPTMKRVYEQVIRRVSLDSSVESYKQYMVGGFMVLEWVATNWLGIDLSGFTKQQVLGMNRYERLLIELGEKNYSTFGSRFPVEIRLLFLIVFNAGLFYVQKMIFSGGEGGLNILNTLFGGNSNNNNNNGNNQTQQSRPRRRNTRMRGPTITPQEVSEMNKNARRSSDDNSSASDEDKDKDV